MDYAARPWLLLLISALLSSSLFDLCAASSYSSPSSQQRRRILQSSTAAPRNIETFFPSNAVPAFSNPPSPPPPPPPPPSAPPVVAQAPQAPPSGSSSRVNVAGAVVATAASTFVVSGLLFFAVQRFAFKQRRVESYQRRENNYGWGNGGGGGVAAKGGNPFRPAPVNGTLKAVVVDEDGLDVLYWRKLEDGNRKRCMHCMQVVGGDGDGGGGGRDGARREQAAARRSRQPREDERRVQQTALLSADSLSSSDRIRSVVSMEPEGSSAPGGAASMKAAAAAAASSEVREVAPVSPLPLPPGRRVSVSTPSSAASSSPSSPPATATLRPTPSPVSPKRLSAAVASSPPPPPPQPPIAPPPPPPPPPPPAPLAAKRTPAPPAPPPPRPNKNPGPPAPPPPPGAGRSGPSPSRPPAVPRSSSRSSAAEGASGETAKAPAKLKPLHWDKMTTANAQHSMVWDKISDGSFRFDDDLMEALFGYVATNRKSPKNVSSSSALANPFAAGGGGPPAQVCLLDPRKSQNTAIVLKSLGVSRQEILDALLEGRGLSSDTLEKLSKVAPTKEEEATILGFSANPSSLADAESFLFHLLRAVPSAFARVDAMLFKANYEPEVVHLRESLRALEAACGELRQQGLFWRMLEAVLKAGNRMNAGTARGNAQAFNLASLRKLSDVKSTDGKTTLLHFVVEAVVRSEGKRCVVNRNHSFGRSASRSTPVSSSPARTPTREEKEIEYVTLGLPVVGGLSAEFANVKKAAAIDYDSLVGACAVLSARVEKGRQLLAACGGDGGGFAREMASFLERAEEELKAVKQEQARVVDLVMRTTEYYMVGATQDKAAPPLQLFLIVKDFLGMVDQACVDVARNLQQQKRKALSGTGSPPAPQKRVPTRFPNLPAHFMSAHSKSSLSSSGGSSNSNSDSEDDGF